MTEIRQNLLFFNIVSLYFNTLFNWYINLPIDGTIYPTQHFPFGAAFVCQAGNFSTLLRTSVCLAANQTNNKSINPSGYSIIHPSSFLIPSISSLSVPLHSDGSVTIMISAICTSIKLRVGYGRWEFISLPNSRIAHRMMVTYDGWNFNFGNAAVTFDTAHLQSSYFHRPSMYSPKLCRTRSQRWGSRMMPLAAPVLLMVRTERSTAEGLTPPCNCPIR